VCCEVQNCVWSSIRCLKGIHERLVSQICCEDGNNTHIGLAACWNCVNSLHASMLLVQPEFIGTAPNYVNISIAKNLMKSRNAAY
jgi:hypothetical protein